MNDHQQEYFNKRKLDATQTHREYYEDPVMYQHDDPFFLSRIWHSNGSPTINSNLIKGTCWCSADEWCMCTPSLAIDVILTSGPDHIWVVRRQDTGLLALMVRPIHFMYMYIYMMYVYCYFIVNLY